jgi:transcriptional regulator with XRE-family HTH domain
MLAETIRQAVKTKGWTLRELERRSGVPYDTIYNVVHARRTDPRFSVVAKLARTLDVSLDDVAAAVLQDASPGEGSPPKSPKRRRSAA